MQIQARPSVSDARAPQSDRRNRGEVQMSATPSPTQSELSKGSLPVKKPLVEVLTIDPADLKNDQFQSEWPWLGKRVPLALALITFCVGVVGERANTAAVATTSDDQAHRPRRISLRACDARDVQIFMQFIDLYFDNGRDRRLAVIQRSEFSAVDLDRRCTHGQFE